MLSSRANPDLGPTIALRTVRRHVFFDVVHLVELESRILRLSEEHIGDGSYMRFVVAQMVATREALFGRGAALILSHSGGPVLKSRATSTTRRADVLMKSSRPQEKRRGLVLSDGGLVLNNGGLVPE